MPRGNAYYGIMDSHPCYIYGVGYECKCGVKSATKEQHDAHVIASHDKEFAREVLGWLTFYKHYEPEKYKQYEDFRKEYNRIKKTLRKQGFVDLKFLGWFNNVSNITILIERDVMNCKNIIKVQYPRSEEEFEITIYKI